MTLAVLWLPVLDGELLVLVGVAFEDAELLFVVLELLVFGFELLPKINAPRATKTTTITTTIAKLDFLKASPSH